MLNPDGRYYTSPEIERIFREMRRGQIVNLSGEKYEDQLDMDELMNDDHFELVMDYFKSHGHSYSKLSLQRRSTRTLPLPQMKRLFKHIRKHLRHLEDFSLRFLQDPEDVRLVSDNFLRGHPTLRRLDLRAWVHESLPPFVINDVCAMPALRELRITAEDTMDVTPLVYIPTLEFLELQAVHGDPIHQIFRELSKVDDNHQQHLRNSSNLTKLHVVAQATENAIRYRDWDFKGNYKDLLEDFLNVVEHNTTLRYLNFNPATNMDCFLNDFQYLWSSPETSHRLARAFAKNQTLQHFFVKFSAYCVSEPRTKKDHLSPDEPERQALFDVLRNQNYTLSSFKTSNWDALTEDEKEGLPELQYYLNLNKLGRNTILREKCEADPTEWIDLLGDNSKDLDWLYHIIRRMHPTLISGNTTTTTTMDDTGSSSSSGSSRSSGSSCSSSSGSSRSSSSRSSGSSSSSDVDMTMTTTTTTCPFLRSCYNRWRSGSKR